MQRRKDRKRESHFQEQDAAEESPACAHYEIEHHKKDCGNLGECIHFAKEARAEVSQSRDYVKHGAYAEDADVAAEDDDCVAPLNQVEDGEHHEHCAQQQFVCDGVEILSDARLLVELSCNQAIEHVGKPGEHEQYQCHFVVTIQQIEDDERKKYHPQEGELVGCGENLRKAQVLDPRSLRCPAHQNSCGVHAGLGRKSFR